MSLCSWWPPRLTEPGSGGVQEQRPRAGLPQPPRWHTGTPTATPAQPPCADPGGPVPTGPGQALGAPRPRGAPSAGSEWADGASQRPDEEALASHPLALSMEGLALEAGPPAWHPEGTAGVTLPSSRGRQVRHPGPKPAKVAGTPGSPTPGGRDGERTQPAGEAAGRWPQDVTPPHARSAAPP